MIIAMIFFLFVFFHSSGVDIHDRLSPLSPASCVSTLMLLGSYSVGPFCMTATLSIATDRLVRWGCEDLCDGIVTIGISTLTLIQWSDECFFH